MLWSSSEALKKTRASGQSVGKVPNPITQVGNTRTVDFMSKPAEKLSLHIILTLRMHRVITLKNNGYLLRSQPQASCKLTLQDFVI